MALSTRYKRNGRKEDLIIKIQLALSHNKEKNIAEIRKITKGYYRKDIEELKSILKGVS